MIEFRLSCDDCGTIIVASKVSASDARTQGRLMCCATRSKRRDLCAACFFASRQKDQPHD